MSVANSSADLQLIFAIGRKYGRFRNVRFSKLHFLREGFSLYREDENEMRYTVPTVPLLKTRLFSQPLSLNCCIKPSQVDYESFVMLTIKKGPGIFDACLGG